MIRTRKIDSAVFTLFHMEHGLGARYTVVWREDGSTTAFAYGDRRINEDDHYAFEGTSEDGYSHLSGALAGVVREFIASGGRTLDEELDEDAEKVIMQEHREG